MYFALHNSARRRINTLLLDMFIFVFPLFRQEARTPSQVLEKSEIDGNQELDDCRSRHWIIDITVVHGRDTWKEYAV